MKKEALSKYVAYKRKDLGLTQKDLAALLSYTPQAVSRFESVNSAFPLAFSDSLCRALDCSLDDLFLRTREITRYAPLPFSLDEIGNLLEEKRKERGLDQESIASACGITSRSLRNYETGKGSVSLQFLDIFCETLSIKPSDLAKKEPPKPEPLPIVPPRTRRSFFVPSLTGAAAFAAAALIMAIFLVPSGQTHSLVESPLSSIQESETITAKEVESSPASSFAFSSVVQASPEEPPIGKYGLEIHPGVPNFLKIQYDKNEFERPGDKIELNLSDAYDNIDFDLTKDRDLDVQGLVSGFSFSYEAISKNQLGLTLLEGHNGEGTALNIRIGGYWFYNVGFFFVHNNDPVYLPSDTEHLFPINRGTVNADFETKIKVNLNDTNYVAYQMTLFHGEEIQSFDEGINPSYMIGEAFPVISRSQSHNFSLTFVSDVGGEYVAIPKPIEVDVFMITGWVEVVGESGNYYYALEPLTVQIVR